MKDFHKIDKVLLGIIIVCIVSLFLFINLSGDTFSMIINGFNYFLTNQIGLYYIIIGVLFGVLVFLIAFSKYGKIRIGGSSAKKEHSNFAWMAMIFTSTMAADVLFFSFHEWMYYYSDAGSTYLSYQSLDEVASTYPLFHWGIIPWSFYLVPATIYAYIMHNKNRNCNKLSDACSPLIKSKIGLKIIDIVGVLGLIITVSTTYSLSTPLLSSAITRLFNINYNYSHTIAVIIFIGVIYCIGSLFLVKGISLIARLSYVFFLLLVGSVLVSGDTSFIIERGVDSIGNMIQNQVGLSTYYSSNTFTEDWTIFYWAYWIAWSIATPFFIATISKGRTIKELLLGGLGAGLLGTFLSFVVLGNAGLALQKDTDFVSSLINGAETPSSIIIKMIDALPNSVLILVLLIITMIFLYVSTLDGIIYVISKYSYKDLKGESSPVMKILWSVIFLIIPIALVNSESSMDILKTLSIIVAFPISIITLIIIVNFIKMIRKDTKSNDV